MSAKKSKKRGKPKAKRCEHKTVTITRHPETGQELARQCSPTFGCRAWLTYGTSDEAPVAIEIRATELSLSWEGHPPMTDEEYRGWLAHHDDLITLDSDAKLAGWLSREMCYAGTERDIGAWSWDPSRPIADQELEIKAQHNALGALCDVVKEAGGTMRLYGAPVTESDLRAHGEQLVEDKLTRIADQTRHDVAASVARHADLDPPGRVPYAEDQLELPVVASAHPGPPLATPDEMREHVPVELVIGDEPEQGVELEVGPLPAGSHDRAGPMSSAAATTEAEPIADLIASSSVGAGLANIRKNGVDAELADLDAELTALASDNTDISDADTDISDADTDISDADLAAIAHAPSREPKSRPACANFAPSWFAGRWRDWHRGHGCDKDDGEPRTAEGVAEIEAARGARSPAGGDA